VIERKNEKTTKLGKKDRHIGGLNQKSEEGSLRKIWRESGKPKPLSQRGKKKNEEEKEVVFNTHQERKNLKEEGMFKGEIFAAEWGGEGGGGEQIPTRVLVRPD